MIGLIAHVDTTPETPGAGVVPIVHEDYDGRPDRPARRPEPGDRSGRGDRSSRQRVGHDIVTSDGTTLLGADDKAGVAEIMAAVAYLRGTARSRAPPCGSRSPSTRRSGAGTHHFDLEAFGAEAPTRSTAPGIGELEIETFSARQVRVIDSRPRRPPGLGEGQARERRQARRRLRRRRCRRTRSRPRRPRGAKGSCIPSRVDGVGRGGRRHADRPRPRRRAARASTPSSCAASQREIEEREPRARVTVEVQETYRQHARGDRRSIRGSSTAAEEAIRRAGVEPVRSIIRGGTDGAVLSAKGLPTPNIFTGGPELPLAARVGERAGHGGGGGDGRRARPGLGRA